jgi:hypothetical protein
MDLREQMNILAGSQESNYIGQEDIPLDQPTLRAKGMTVEADLLEKRWSEFGIMKGCNMPKETAVMLENQRLYNEQSCDTSDVAQFKRISIPLIRRIFGNSLLGNFVSVQPMLGPAGKIYYMDNGSLISDDTVTSTRRFKAVWCYEGQQNIRSQNNLDAEAELTAILSQEIGLELQRSIFKDMINCAALKKEIDYNCLKGSPQDNFLILQNLITGLAKENKEFWGGPFPNWMVVSAEVAMAINSYVDENDDCFNIKKHKDIETEHGNISVYVDHLIGNNILLGYQGEDKFDTGYVYSPYVGLSQTPVVLDPNTFMPVKGLLTREAKRMVQPTYYSVLTVKNFIK